MLDSVVRALVAIFAKLRSCAAGIDGYRRQNQAWSGVGRGKARHFASAGRHIQLVPRLQLSDTRKGLNMPSRVQEPSSVEKVAEVDEHIGVAMSGLTADARTLIDHARVETQVYCPLTTGVRAHLTCETVSSIC